MQNGKIRLKKSSILSITGLAFLILCFIPITGILGAIDTTFTVNSGTSYGPYDEGTVYHTTVLGWSRLIGVVNVEGEPIYLTVNGANTLFLENISVEDQFSFIINPANDQYTFIFENRGTVASSEITFTLYEIWTRPLSLGTHPSILLFILGLAGISLFITGLVAYVIIWLEDHWGNPCTF